MVSLSELQELAARVGFPHPALAAAVAMAESNGEAVQSRILRADGTRERSWGYWQINTDAHPQYDPGLLLTEPLYNAHAALTVSRNGADFTPWTEFRNGGYKRFMPPGSS